MNKRERGREIKGRNNKRETESEDLYFYRRRYGRNIFKAF